MHTPSPANGINMFSTVQAMYKKLNLFFLNLFFNLLTDKKLFFNLVWTIQNSVRGKWAIGVIYTTVFLYLWYNLIPCLVFRPPCSRSLERMLGGRIIKLATITSVILPNIMATTTIVNVKPDCDFSIHNLPYGIFSTPCNVSKLRA